MEKENTLDLQLFSSVSNPYTFTLDGDYNVSATIEEIEMQPADLSYYAQNDINNYKSIESIPDENLSYLTSGLYATKIIYMFFNCNRLKAIPDLRINTSKITDMSYMLCYCWALSSCNDFLLNLDTSNVENMSHMFDDCNSLTSLNLSSFNTDKVNNMSYMFRFCNSLTSLNLSSFNTINVMDMDSMFYNCESLTLLDLSSFNTSNVNNMNSMFYGCNMLQSLNLSSFSNTINLTDIGSMFNSCTSLISLDLSNLDTSKVENMSYMFNGCESLVTIDGIIDMDSCTNYFNMFQNCSKLTGVKIKNPPSGFDGAGLKYSQYTIVS